MIGPGDSPGSCPGARTVGPLCGSSSLGAPRSPARTMGRSIGLAAAMRAGVQYARIAASVAACGLIAGFEIPWAGPEVCAGLTRPPIPGIASSRMASQTANLKGISAPPRGVLRPGSVLRSVPMLLAADTCRVFVPLAHQACGCPSPRALSDRPDLIQTGITPTRLRTVALPLHILHGVVYVELPCAVTAADQS